MVDHEWGQLQLAFASGSPVIVLGPGCHRIGYDDPDRAWKRVVDRVTMIWTALDRPGLGEEYRLFLRQFWESKLSEETRREVGQALPPGHNIEQEKPTPPREQTRVALAIALLEALVASTEALGEVIARGKTPISDWLDVSLPPDADEAAPAAAIQRAAALAYALATPGGAVEAKTLAEAGLAGVPTDPAYFTHMKIGAISESLKKLHKHCFVIHDVRLSGALVEWLSDVLWHVVISGSGVPASQDELAFYVNLAADAVVTEQGVGFNRPRPGDYRQPDRDGVALTSDIRALLKRSEPDLGVPDWNRPRERFAATMAASLVESWRQDVTVKGRKPLALALVADYDVLLERAILQALDVDEHLHTVMPAWVTRLGERRMEWVIASLERSSEQVGRDDVLTPASWRWFESHEGTFPELARPEIGPIVVKLSGSPLHLTREGVPAAELGFDEPAGYEDASLTVATVFSEHDSLEAILSLAESAAARDTLASTLFESAAGLNWQKRAWLFFGHRFSDWLPRLRLFFAANGMGRPRKERTGMRNRGKIAVDRGFDHPERALLAALEIAPYKGDLRNVAGYYARPNNTYLTNEDVRKFCNAVARCLSEKFDVGAAA